VVARSIGPSLLPAIIEDACAGAYPTVVRVRPCMSDVRCGPDSICSCRVLPVMTRSRHRAEAFQIEAQAGPGSGIPPAKMSQRVSLSDGEGLLPSLCSDEPRAERTDQRVRQRSTHRVRDFVFARFAERPVFARPNLWCMIFIDRERHGVIEQTEARSWAAKMSPNGNSAAMHAAIEPRRAGAE
jgi:hypothetical protein